MSILKNYNGSSWVPTNSVVTGDTLPIGSIVPFAGTSTPAGWLICDGRTLLRSEYKTLFSVIGTKYGEGDGSTTFNIPDLRGKVAVGTNASDTDFNSVGKTGGEKTHTLSVDEMPSHNHNSNLGEGMVVSGTSGANASIRNDGYAFQYSVKMANTGSDQPHNNLQPYMVTNYIIKASQTSGYVGTISGTKSNSDKDTYSCDYINKLKPVIYKHHVKDVTLTAGFSTQSIGELSSYDGYTLVGFQILQPGWSDQNVCNITRYANKIWFSSQCQIDTTMTLSFYEVFVRNDLIEN